MNSYVDHFGAAIDGEVVFHMQQIAEKIYGEASTDKMATIAEEIIESMKEYQPNEWIQKFQIFNYLKKELNLFVFVLFIIIISDDFFYFFWFQVIFIARWSIVIHYSIGK